MRAASLQFFATPFDRERNLATAARLARGAAAQGAELLVLPEMFNTGYVYSPRLTEAAEDEGGPTVSWLHEQSKALRVHLAGSLLLRRSGHVYNCLALAAPDGELHTYRKRYPFLWERCYFEAGSEPLIADTALGRFGLLVCWDAAQAAAWASCVGRADALLITSTPARFHRAVLNFPGAQKAYLAQLMPSLVQQRDALDGLYSTHIAACAAGMGVPVVHAVMAGRFVTQLPFPRLSLLSAAWRRPRYWPLARQAHLATLRATFYGGSAIYDGQGATLAQVTGEEGMALAEVALGSRAPAARPLPRAPVPAELRVLERLLRPLAAGAYQREQGRRIEHQANKVSA